MPPEYPVADDAKLSFLETASNRMWDCLEKVVDASLDGDPGLAISRYAMDAEEILASVAMCDLEDPEDCAFALECVASMLRIRVFAGPSADDPIARVLQAVLAAWPDAGGRSLS